LEGSGNHKVDGLAGTLRQNVHEIPLGALFHIQPPKTILDVPFGHKDTGLVLCFGKGVDDASQEVT
jgi:hypothetical protein